MKRCFFALTAVFSLFFSGNLFAESFRVAKLHPVNIASSFDIATVKAGINDGISISYSQENPYITGFEISLKIPQAVAAWRDTIAFSTYSQVSPSPSAKIIDYSGTRSGLTTLPGKLTHTIYIPLNKKFAVKENPYSTILEQYAAQKGIIFTRFMLAMKGAPQELEQAEFEISIKPVLSNEGQLKLSVSQGQFEDVYQVFVDDTKLNGNSIILGAGEHHLSITSEAYRNEVRTFYIDQAKTTELQVILRSVEPALKITSPENAQIFLDGEPFANKKEAIEITPGEHTVKFILGDYEVTKTITAQKGRSYTVNLNIDANITESE